MMPDSSKRCRADSGFSVLELLVVLAVLAVSAAVVAPRVSASLTASNLDVAAHRIAAAMIRTRSVSLRDAEPRDFSLDFERRSYQADPRQKANVVDPGVALSARGFDRSLGGNRVLVRFRPDGTASGGVLVLRKGRYAAEIDVDWLTGEVRVRRAR
jgi:general secretion pathway protein H